MKLKRNSYKNGRGYCGYHSTWDNKKVFCRSLLEKIQCLLLDKQKKYYLLEKQIFVINKKTYKPDFFIYTNSNYTNIYKIIEIKGSRKDCNVYNHLYYDYFKSIDIEYIATTHDSRIYKNKDEFKLILEDYISMSSSYNMSGKNNPAYGIKFTKERRKEHSKIMLECQNRPEVIEKHRIASKKAYANNPELRKIISKKQSIHQEKVRVKKYGNKKENSCTFCGGTVFTYEKLNKKYCTSRSCSGKWSNYLAKLNGNSGHKHTEESKIKLMRGILIKHGLNIMNTYLDITEAIIIEYKLQHCRLKSRFSINSIKKYFKDTDTFVSYIKEMYENN